MSNIVIGIIVGFIVLIAAISAQLWFQGPESSNWEDFTSKLTILLSGYNWTARGFNMTNNLFLSYSPNCDTLDTDSAGRVICGTDGGGVGGGGFFNHWIDGGIYLAPNSSSAINVWINDSSSWLNTSGTTNLSTTRIEGNLTIKETIATIWNESGCYTFYNGTPALKGCLITDCGSKLIIC